MKRSQRFRRKELKILRVCTGTRVPVWGITSVHLKIGSIYLGFQIYLLIIDLIFLFTQQTRLKYSHWCSDTSLGRSILYPVPPEVLGTTGKSGWCSGVKVVRERIDCRRGDLWLLPAIYVLTVSGEQCSGYTHSPPSRRVRVRDRVATSVVGSCLIFPSPGLVG